MKKTILITLALTITMLFSVSNIANALEMIDYKFKPEQQMTLTELHLTFKNNDENPVKAFTGTVTCKNLLDEEASVNIKATGKRIGNEPVVLKYQGVGFGLGNIWDMAQTGMSADHTCEFKPIKVIK